MGSMAEQGLWPGVERAYERMLALDDIQIPYDAHYTAAQAARARGDMAAALERLERAATLKRPPGLSGWLEELEGQYGRVEIGCSARKPPELRPDVAPLHPDMRAQIDLAREQITTSCSFKGLLPAGGYSLGKRTFEVVPGMTLRLDVGGG